MQHVPAVGARGVRGHLCGVAQQAGQPRSVWPVLELRQLQAEGGGAKGGVQFYVIF